LLHLSAAARALTKVSTSPDSMTVHHPQTDDDERSMAGTGRVRVGSYGRSAGRT